MTFRRPLWDCTCIALLSVSLACNDDPAALEPNPRSWKKDSANPVLSHGPEGSWDALGVSTPFVLRVGDGFWMWYSGRGASRTQIGVATSTDGMAWTKHPSNPILAPGLAGTWDAHGVEDPCVLFDGARYTMYYAGAGDSSGGIGVAMSPDGIQWTRSGGDPVLTPSPSGTAWDDERVDAPWVVQTSGHYEMWYGGRGDLIAIGYATSIDAVEWSKLLLPVLHPQVLEALSFAPCVVKEGASVRMWYGALHESPGGDVFPGVIDNAQSSDGVEWSAHHTVLSPGAPGAWDAHHLRSARVLDVNGTLTMWYEGEGAPGGTTQSTTAIGRATLE